MSTQPQPKSDPQPPAPSNLAALTARGAPSPLETLCLLKLVTDEQEKSARQTCPAGEHRVDFNLRVLGTIKIGEPSSRTDGPRTDAWGLLAVAVELAGLDLDAIYSHWLENVDGRTKEPGEKAKERIDEIARLVKGETQTPVSGRISPRLSVEVVR